MTDQYLQNVNDKKILLQESLGEPLCECIMLSDKLKNLIVSGLEATEQYMTIWEQRKDVIKTITQIIEGV